MHEPFIVADGSVIHTLHDLAHALRRMPRSVFEHHVNAERNDFATWIAHSLGLPGLAERVKPIRDQDALLAVIEAYLLAQQEQERKTRSREPLQKRSEGEALSTRPASTRRTEQEERREEDDWIDINTILNEETPTRKEEKMQGGEKRTVTTREETAQRRMRGEGEVAQREASPPPAQPSVPLPKPSPHSSPTPSPTPSAEAVQSEDSSGRVVQTRTALPVEAHAEEGPAYQEAVKHYQQPLGAETISEKEVKEYADILHQMKKEIAKVYIGQTDVVEKVLLALTCDAHALLEGVPGLAKSLLVETLGHIVKDASFKRIQFLPDMLPADVLGTEVFNPQTGEFRVVKGPIFANFVLADEINRAPPKTHAALMEAMQEKKVNIGDHEFILDRPFLVLATQNPLEQKGTYSLPEAVLDRFMFKIILDYPLREHEKIILTENATVKKDIFAALREVVDKETFLRMQRRVKDVYVSDRIREYILDLIEATRGKNKKIEGMKFVKYGAGPRAGIYLTIGAKARALTQGRNFVLPEDVMYVAPDILRHRIFLNYTGKAYEISTDKIVEEILLKVNPL